jgi:hypothetical protein
MITIEGIYKNGQVVLAETPIEMIESKVLVTFLDMRLIDLQERGISKEQAAEIRGNFNSIAEDWNRPEMDIYDVD